jgi:hypothetical protein
MIHFINECDKCNCKARRRLTIKQHELLKHGIDEEGL